MKKYISEILGTMMLVFFGCSSIVLSNQYGLGLLGVALTFGLALTIALILFGKQTKGYFNPAVAFAKYLDNKITIQELVVYIISQIFGAILGVLLLMFIMKNTELTLFATKTLGQNGFGSTFLQSKITLAGALTIELILTSVFVLTVLKTTKEEDKMSPVIIGLSFTLMYLIALPLTGASINPARSIAPAIFVGVDALKQLWVFIIAPMFGSLLAYVVYKYLEKDTKKRK